MQSNTWHCMVSWDWTSPFMHTISSTLLQRHQQTWTQLSLKTWCRCPLGQISYTLLGHCWSHSIIGSMQAITQLTQSLLSAVKTRNWTGQSLKLGFHFSLVQLHHQPNTCILWLFRAQKPSTRTVQQMTNAVNLWNEEQSRDASEVAMQLMLQSSSQFLWEKEGHVACKTHNAMTFICSLCNWPVLSNKMSKIQSSASGSQTFVVNSWDFVDCNAQDSREGLHHSKLTKDRLWKLWRHNWQLRSYIFWYRTDDA